MDIIVSGIIVQALPVQSGVSQRGTQWSRASYVIEHESGQYPRRMVFDVSGNKIQELNLQVGETVTLHLNIQCREYPENSGRFFNSIEAWRADRQAQQMAPQGYQQPQYQQAPPQQYAQPQYAPPTQTQAQPVGQTPFPQQQAPAQQNPQFPFPPAQ